MKIKGKAAVVTGGASGLGRATCEHLVAKGGRVAIFDVNDAAATAVAKQLGENAVYVHVDVADEESVATGVLRAVEALGALHICVNCAGIGTPAKTLSRGKPADLDLFKKVIRINLIGTFDVLRLVASEMARNDPVGDSGERGVIVNTSSGAAKQGQVGQAAYSASKAAILGMALPIARDLSRAGIRINTILPGLFDTPLIGGIPDAMREHIIAGIEMPRRLGRPSEFAKLVGHVIENPYLNAAAIALDAAAAMPAR